MIKASYEFVDGSSRWYVGDLRDYNREDLLTVICQMT